MNKINNTEINLEILNGLTESERQAVFSVLSEIKQTGNSKTLEDIKYADYDEIPVDITTFIHDRQYLGNGLYDPEGRFTLFPYWEEKLKDIFPTNTTTKYNTIIFTGAIGLGKSTIAVICQLYLLYRLLCLKDPYLFYGLQPIDKISIAQVNITLDNAKGVAMDKMNQMILVSPWFMSHGEMHGVSNLNYVPNKHIELIVASSNNQLIGRAVFCLDGETIIKTISGDAKLQDLVNKKINVVSVDDLGNTCESLPCVVVPTIVTNEEIEITLADGSTIKCTPNHRFMLADGTYKEAQLLTEDDELLDIIKI